MKIDAGSVGGPDAAATTVEAKRMMIKRDRGKWLVWHSRGGITVA